MKNHSIEQPEFQNYKYRDVYIELSRYRVIFLNEEITKELATAISSLLLYYDSISDQEITMYINTNGGDTAALFQMYDVMQMIDSPIKTICTGKAYSAGAVLLSAGTNGLRFCMKHSSIMIHGVQCAFPIIGESDVDGSSNFYSFLDKHNNDLLKVLANHTGKEISKVKKDCERDFFMDAKTALNYGIVDGII